MKTELQVMMLSNRMHYNRTKGVIPALIFLQYKRKYFCMVGGQFNFKSVPNEKTSSAIHCWKSFLKSIFYQTPEDDAFFTDKRLYRAFKHKRIKVVGIILYDYITKERINHLEDFRLDNKADCGVTIKTDKGVFRNLKISKHFKFY